MNNSFSLHKIENEDVFTFNPSSYSKFKFGYNHFAKQFAIELFDGFIAQYGDFILAQEEVVVLPSPYLAIPTASNFLCAYFKNRLNDFLYNHNKKAVVESKIFRNQTYVTDYGELDFEKRISLISNDTYYIDRNFINNKFCIFVDDIKITGSHEHTVNKILTEYDVKGKFLFVYFAELVNKSIHPKIENYLNYFYVKGVDNVIEIIQDKSFQFNTRIIKYVLKLKQEELKRLLDKIDRNKSEELFILSVSNNYHQIPEYSSNLTLIKKYNYGN